MAAMRIRNLLIWRGRPKNSGIGSPDLVQGIREWAEALRH